MRRGPGRRGGTGTGAVAEALTGASPTALAVKFGARQRSPHYLLVKEHQVREGAGAVYPPRRTLFVLNVPPYCGPVSGAGRLEAGGAGRAGGAAGGGPGARPVPPEAVLGAGREWRRSACCFTGRCVLCFPGVKDALSRLFARCGHVQAVHVCDKPEPGEKKEKLTSKYFNRKPVTVKLAEWGR